MTIAEYTQLAKDLRRVARKYRASATEQEHAEIAGLANEAEHKAAQKLNPATVPEIRSYDRTLHAAALIELINTLDTTVDLDMDQDAPGFFCVDGYVDMLMSNERLTGYILASHCVTPQDVIGWLDVYDRKANGESVERIVNFIQIKAALAKP